MRGARRGVRLAALGVAAAAACILGCQKKEPRETHLADLTGVVVELASRGGPLSVRLDARGCPVLGGDLRADLDGAPLTRDVSAPPAEVGEARGCSARFTSDGRGPSSKNLVITITDGTAKIVVEALPFAQKSGFKLTSRASLASLRVGDSVFVEAYGPVAKLARAELSIATRKGERFKVPPAHVTVSGKSVGFSLPDAALGQAGATVTLPESTGELTITADADAVVRCEGAARCAAPVRLVTAFALGIVR